MSSNSTFRASGTAAALAVVVLSAGCSLLPSSGSETGAAEPSPAAASNGASAAPSPKPPVATPAAPADYGARSYGDEGAASVTLTGVHRITDSMAMVSISVKAQRDQSSVYNFWSDPGLRRTGDSYKNATNDYYLSGVTVTAQGNPNIYATVTDGNDHCLCSRAPGSLRAGETTSGWAYVSMPQGATTVNVTVGDLEPWVGVPVS